MRLLALFLLYCLLAPAPARATDFDLGLAYGQSRDFWSLVQGIQDNTGSISGIESLVKDRYGRPDILYSYLDASYAYKHDHFASDTFGQLVIGTRAEALAGGEVSNPVFPQIQAYANTTGIASIGYQTEIVPGRRTFLQVRLLGGLGPEKRLYAEGAEFLDNIPVRNGMLFLAGASFQLLDHAEVGEDFYITTDLLLRPEYFLTTVDAPASKPDQKMSFGTVRWKLQNEWLKDVGSLVGSRARVGLITVTGQTPLPFLNLPITWDYQQRLKVYSGFRSISGVGAMGRLLNDRSLPNVAVYAGYFGGAVGGGVDVQLGPVVLNASSYGIENFLTPARELTRLWNASLGIAL